MDAHERQTERDRHGVILEIGSLRTDLDLLGADVNRTAERLSEIAQQPGWDIHQVATVFKRRVDNSGWQAKIDAVVQRIG